MALNKDQFPHEGTKHDWLCVDNAKQNVLANHKEMGKEIHDSHATALAVDYVESGTASCTGVHCKGK